MVGDASERTGLGDGGGADSKPTAPTEIHDTMQLQLPTSLQTLLHTHTHT